MNVQPFLRFTLNSRYIKRWIFPGLIILIPPLNFFSLGYLSRTSRITMIGGIGLPTWENKKEIAIEGVKLLFVFILYNAISFFLFSSGFFLTTLNAFTAFLGRVIMMCSYAALVVCCYPIPFALVCYSESEDFRRALEFETILKGIKDVFVEYIVGYGVTLIGLFVCYKIARVLYPVGFLFASVLSYYLLLCSTYYFTELYKKTSLAAVRMDQPLEPPATASE